MKNILVGLIIFFLIPITILSIIIFNRYHNENEKIDKSVENRLLDERNTKQEELYKVKEENKEKIAKYEKVRQWNEEIIYYFD